MIVFIIQATYKSTFEKNCGTGQRNLEPSHLVANKRFIVRELATSEKQEF